MQTLRGWAAAGSFPKSFTANFHLGKGMDAFLQEILQARSSEDGWEGCSDE